MKTIILLGPTAVGKTVLSIELARNIGAEIISADSMQVYRGLDIGTAKPTLEERQGIPHHLIDIRYPDEEWTVSDFIKGTNNLTTQPPIKIIVGGTGLYLWSLLEGFSFPISPADHELRTKLEKLDLNTLNLELRTIDPQSADKIHPHDKKRLIRALEVFKLTGKKISELQKHRTSNIELRTQNYLIIGLDLPRVDLYERINQRVDHMFARGLVNEVKGLLDKGYSPNLPSLQALGYKEVIAHNPENSVSNNLVEEIKKKTRNFARRQMTWFRRFPEVHWFSPFDKDKIFELVSKHG
ncbi:tRNA (adenosine(37)-N6)-dimethylallyltransferase MiaA [candidate division WOR-1 bacterium RIFOXYB2_FULL_48_7]|uniref:tRNA dimethylallyltransferase n=1 Tax=candidate division WOR-1 bacterium RIFOXYB2_FULL_48_7 TaxID=1802583 RepID=A0A1F4TDP8_UNCSA|nr:MAG: tRNA (adenosine(37)-N6)-dimethylallyltransferase MiaA [candidate division WOR-1 bacterium RIFOXYB2_FULL_48_7]